ncbi:MAG: NUDIX domain-containing protein [Deltaproteobacteria bacterium]|nr:NUDIX domain-containing protein [Deltaproteobacteria bacterium]
MPTPRLRHLASLLDGHLTADAGEAHHLERMRALLEQGEASLSRENDAPGHFTASAFVLGPDRTELLLILHTKLGLWLQPGGHVEPDDATVLEAARREVREEVGLDDVVPLGAGLFDVDVHTIPASARGPAHEHHDLRFLFVARTRVVRAGDDAAAARWVPLDAFGSAASAGSLPSDESVMRAVRRLRSRLGE